MKKFLKCLIFLAIVGCGGYLAYTNREKIKKWYFG